MILFQVEAHSSAPFWSKTMHKEKLMKLKLTDKPGESVLFAYAKQQSTLLKLNNEVIFLTIDLKNNLFF